jgi:starch phosphorylase
VQLILAGKADPADMEGQALIQKWMQFIQRPEVRPHVIFLTDYDMEMTRHLVQGVDVWLNTPRRPWEACGTSGMKVLANGGLNFSELDGWWAEAYVPDLGWELGDGKVHGMDAHWDRAEAEMLYDVLESDVIPEFYARDSETGKDAEGIPRAWIARIRESMARLTPRFSASRTVCEYTVQHYVPAATAFKLRSAENGARGIEIVDWQQSLSHQWPAMRFGAVKVETVDSQHHFQVQLCLHGIDPGSVRVELFANADPQRDDVGIVRQEMQQTGHWNGTRGGFVYSASVSAYRPTTDYVPRIVPLCNDVAIPLEDVRILWQR